MSRGYQLWIALESLLTFLMEINIFQGEDVIQDRFVVHLKPYRSIRELLAKGVISGNIEDIAVSVTVRISTIILI